MINFAGNNKNLQIRKLVIAIFAVLISSYFFLPGSIDNFIGAIAKAQNKNTKPRTRRVAFPDFPHTQHKLECNNCHKFPSSNWKQVRAEKDAFPDITDYPKHESCLNCHKQKFFRGRPPQVCSTCHTNPGPRDSSRHAFPNPREVFDTTAKGKQAVSDFEISFPHDKHVDIVSKLESSPGNVNARRNGGLFMVKAGFVLQSETDSCSVCHQTYRPQGDGAEEYETKPPEKWGDAFWLKKGTFKTKPIGHTVCFTCHSPDTGLLPAPTDCATCHKHKQKELLTDFDAKLAAQIRVDDKRLMDTWKKRDSSATFRHEWFSHTELSCTTCHKVREMITTDVQSKKIKVLSCGGDGTGCHITPTSDDGGILNIEIDSRKADVKFQCVKCHLTYGKSAIPESHLQAIAGFAPK